MTKNNPIANEEENVMNLDRILTEEVGPCGKFQIMVVALCCLVSTFYGVATSAYVFTIAQIKTRCVIPECEHSSITPLNYSPPWILNAVPASGSTFDNCHRFVTNSSLQNTESCPPDLFDRNSVVTCDEFVYEHANSAVFEYDLACDNWRPYLIGSINVLGLVISLPIGGFVADRWGRRLALSISAFNLAWIGCIMYFAPSYNSFLFISFAQSVFGAASFSCAYVLAIEYVGPKYRMVAGSMVGSFCSVGKILLSLIGWTGIYWRYLIIVMHLLSLITIAYFWIAPESIRWLMSKGRYEEAKDMLKKAAEINGNSLSENTLKAFSEYNDESVKETDKSELWRLLFKHPAILLRCVITSIWWMTSLLVFHGLILSSVAISGNKYLNFCVISIMSILGYNIGAILVNITGRKPLLIAGFWICGICQCAYIFIPNGYYLLSLTVYMTGASFSSLCLFVVYIYTCELYPTQYRTSLFSLSSMVGRLGDFLAPFSPALGAEVWVHLPFALFGGAAFVSGLLVVLTPETRGTTLPNTMEEAVDLGKPTFNSCGSLFKKKCYNVN